MYHIVTGSREYGFITSLLCGTQSLKARGMRPREGWEKFVKCKKCIRLSETESGKKKIKRYLEFLEFEDRLQEQKDKNQNV